MARRNRGIAVTNHHEPQDTTLTMASSTDQPSKNNDTDQRSIQPASDFSHQGYASETQASSTQAFSTPVKRSQPFQQHGNLGRRDMIGSPDGGVSLRPSSISRAPESPKARANIGIRRARQKSVLLKSPARLGHASRMRQIFEQASLDDAMPRRDNGVALYPQLPNISRAGSLGSPVPSTQRSKMHLAAAPDAGVVLQHPPRSPFTSSESWSGDSVYLVTEAPPTAPSPPTFFRPINDWLAMVSPDSSFTQEAEPLDSGEMASQSPDAIFYNWPQVSPQTTSFSSDLFQPFNDNVSDILAPSNFHLNGPPSPLKNITNRHRPTEISSPQRSYELDDGGIEISPFNPNVCTARGPSRYHNLQSSRSSRQASRPPRETPCSPIRCKAERAEHKTLELVSETLEQSAKTSRLGQCSESDSFLASPRHR